MHSSQTSVRFASIGSARAVSTAAVLQAMALSPSVASRVVTSVYLSAIALPPRQGLAAFPCLARLTRHSSGLPTAAAQFQRWAFLNTGGAMPSSSLSSTAVPCKGAYCEGLRVQNGIRDSRPIHSRRGRLALRTFAAGLRFQGQHLSCAEVRAASDLSFPATT